MGKSRTESTARRKARKVKSGRSLREMPTRQERRRAKDAAAERRKLEKHQNCPYHGVSLDPKNGETKYYAEGVDKAFILGKWDNSGWPLWFLKCEHCDETWMHYLVQAHP